MRFKNITKENIRVMCFAVFLDVLTLDAKTPELHEKVVRQFHI